MARKIAASMRCLGMATPAFAETSRRRSQVGQAARPTSPGSDEGERPAARSHRVSLGRQRRVPVPAGHSGRELAAAGMATLQASRTPRARSRRRTNGKCDATLDRMILRNRLSAEKSRFRYIAASPVLPGGRIARPADSSSAAGRTAYTSRISKTSDSAAGAKVVLQHREHDVDHPRVQDGEELRRPHHRQHGPPLPASFRLSCLRRRIIMPRSRGMIRSPRTAAVSS